MFEAIEKAEELMDDGMPELAMIEAFEILKMKRTPATDAWLKCGRRVWMLLSNTCLTNSKAQVTLAFQ
jgi:hypothetical protein